MKVRRYDIDWLRVIAMLAVFVFHCTRFFDPESWHLKNPEQSEFLFVLVRALIWPWVMELFFVLSGAGTWFALKSRTGGPYLVDRAKRLLIPLYTVGLFILIPPQVYFEKVTNAGYTGTFWEMLAGYYRGIPAELVGSVPRALNDPGNLVPFGFTGHLWFIRYLFVVSVVTLPLVLYLRSDRGRAWIDRLAGLFDSRGGIFLFVIPLALILICFRSLFSGTRTWADFLWYTAFFIIGYVMVADKRFTESIKRHGWLCLAVWLAGFFGGIIPLVMALGYDPMPGKEGFSLPYVLFQVLWSLTGWSAVVFMLSLGAKYLTRNTPVLAYGNEAVLPFYLLHQTVILCVGWFVIPWTVGILPKLLVIGVVSFVLIMGLYELLIRRHDVVRFFFGMRPKRKPSPTPLPPKE